MTEEDLRSGEKRRTRRRLDRGLGGIAVFSIFIVWDYRLYYLYCVIQ